MILYILSSIMLIEAGRQNLRTIRSLGRYFISFFHVSGHQDTLNLQMSRDLEIISNYLLGKGRDFKSSFSTDC